MGSCGLCSIQTRHLFTRVQRKNKGLVCVKKWGESLGGHDAVRNSGDNEERWCVLCLVSVFRSSLLSFFRHVFDSGFRRRGRENKALYVSQTLQTWSYVSCCLFPVGSMVIACLIQVWYGCSEQSFLFICYAGKNGRQ